MLPTTVKLVKEPTLVIFGCADVYTVPAINAFATCPETFAPATLFATLAKLTCPLTFAPATLLATLAKETCPTTFAPTKPNKL